MKVTKKLAAQMVGVSRMTFYRHIEKKQISVLPGGKIDVSELIRVYGNENVRTPEQLEQSAKPAVGHNGTRQDTQVADEVKRLRGELENITVERKRERDQLTDQIEYLKDSLKQSLDQNNSLTRLLTDERANEEQRALRKQTEQEKTLEEVLRTVKSLAESRKKGWWPLRKRALEAAPAMHRTHLSS